MKKIEDFTDYNYENIVFDIGEVDKTSLRHKLLKDYVNHLYELDDARFIAIWNCDLQGFKRKRDIYFDSYDRVYVLAKLINVNDEWFYEVADSNAIVRKDLWI